VISGDGRRFVITTIDTPLRGWWFVATAEDGSTTLETNWRLVWDDAAGAWRPG